MVQGIASWLHKNTLTLFLLAAAILLVICPLFQKGTFIDGMLYKTVAFNDSENLSAFWQMKFTDSSMATFCEQPPLYFYLLGGFYKLFGTSLISDRAFTLLLFAALFLLLRETMRITGTRSLSGLLVLFLLSIPVFCWSYVNQVIEPLLCLLTASGIFVFTRFINGAKLHNAFLYGLILAMLFLTKGFQSCFIVMLPIIYFFLQRKSGRSPLYFGAFAGLVFLVPLALIIAFYGPANTWFRCYYNARLVLTMQNVGSTTDQHSEIIIRFFTELAGPLLLTAALLVFLVRKKKYPLKFALRYFGANKLAMSLLITSLLGSFPYALSLVQRGFYLLPSFICFALALVLGFRRYWLSLAKVFNAFLALKMVRSVALLLVAGATIYFVMHSRDYKRDETLITDIAYLEPELKAGETVYIEEEVWNYFSLHAYLYMSRHVSLQVGRGHAGFYIRHKNSGPLPYGSGYVKMAWLTRELDFYWLPDGNQGLPAKGK